MCRRDIIHDSFGRAVVFGTIWIFWPKIQPCPLAGFRILQLRIPMSHKLFDRRGVGFVTGFGKHVEDYFRYAAPGKHIRPCVNQPLTGYLCVPPFRLVEKVAHCIDQSFFIEGCVTKVLLSSFLCQLKRACASLGVF